MDTTTPKAQMMTKFADNSPDSRSVVIEHVVHEVNTDSHRSRRRRANPVGHLRVLDDVSLHVVAGETVGIVGPSGCGKTTLLNMMAGLLRPTHGSIRLNGVEVHKPDRRTGYLTARAGLMPWRTVLANVQAGLTIRGIRGDESRDRAMEMIELVQLGEFANWHPLKLSQGMRQRVALARTLAIRPSILLMDEPFAALDVQTKLNLQQEFLSIHDGSRSVVWVTHDVNEAVALCDRILVMSRRPGRIKTEIAVPFGATRDLASLRFQPTFQQLCETVWKEIDNDDDLT